MLEARDLEYDYENDILQNSVMRFNSFYCKLCDFMIKENLDISDNAFRLKAYRQLSMILV